MSKYVTMSNLGTNGRLGNILFQLNVLFYISDKYNYKIAFDNSQHKLLKEFCLINFENIENLGIKFINYFEQEEFGDKYLDKFIKNNSNKNINLSGFFQSFYYLKNQYIKYFFNNSNLLNLDNYFISYKTYNKIGIHIRLGDYVDEYRSIFNCIINWNLDYNLVINNIISLFNKIYPNNRFFVFSDSIDKCKEILDNKELIFIDSHNTSLQDMYLLSKCDHFILTNSTFGYWSYILNLISRDKIEETYCFFPDKYFLDNTYHERYNKKLISSWFNNKMKIYTYSTDTLNINKIMN